MMPNASMMPINGGRLVNDLKTGTNNRQAIPKISMVIRSPGVNTCSTFDIALSSDPSDAIVPCIMREAINTGTKVDTKLGNNSDSTNGREVTFPLTHNIMVVTSPIGDQAPPLFAAMMMILAKSHLSFAQG